MCAPILIPAATATISAMGLTGTAAATTAGGTALATGISATSAAMIAAGAASAAMGAYGQIQQANAQAAQYKYMASMQDQRALLAQRIGKQNITLTQEAGAMASKQLSMKTARLYGAQTAAVGANQIGIESVTAADITADTFDKAKMDELAIRHEANLKSWAINEETNYGVWNATNQKKQYLMAAKNAKQAGYMNAGTSLLSSMASMGMMLI